MQEFFKLFEVDGHQVMVERNSNDEDQEHIILSAHVNNIRIACTIGGIESAESVDNTFKNKVDQTFVEGIMKSLIESALQA